MNSNKLTVIVTAHNESLLLGPTITSIITSAENYKRECGDIEYIIGLDSPDEVTHKYIKSLNLTGWKFVELSCKDSGETRNKLIDIADGEFIALVDGDDLVSENWFSKGVARILDSDKKKLVVHPEINWIFDEENHVWYKTSMDSCLFNPYYFYFGNYYDTMCIARKQCYSEVRFKEKSKGKKFGYEDWSWNMDTIASGWVHCVAHDTFIFKRRRDHSVSQLENMKNAFPRKSNFHDIENIKHLIYSNYKY